MWQSNEGSVFSPSYISSGTVSSLSSCQEHQLLPYQCSCLTQLKRVQTEMSEAALCRCNIHCICHLGTATFLHHCFCMKSLPPLPHGNPFFHHCVLLPYSFPRLPHSLHKDVKLKHPVFLPSLQQVPNSVDREKKVRWCKFKQGNVAGDFVSVSQGALAEQAFIS